MLVGNSRRGFLIGGATLTAALLTDRWAIAQERPSRKITVYKDPT